MSNDMFDRSVLSADVSSESKFQDLSELVGLPVVILRALAGKKCDFDQLKQALVDTGYAALCGDELRLKLLEELLISATSVCQLQVLYDMALTWGNFDVCYLSVERAADLASEQEVASACLSDEFWNLVALMASVKGRCYFGSLSERGTNLLREAFIRRLLVNPAMGYFGLVATLRLTERGSTVHDEVLAMCLEAADTYDKSAFLYRQAKRIGDVEAMRRAEALHNEQILKFAVEASVSELVNRLRSKELIRGSEAEVTVQRKLQSYVQEVLAEVKVTGALDELQQLEALVRRAGMNVEEIEKARVELSLAAAAGATTSEKCAEIFKLSPLEAEDGRVAKEILAKWFSLNPSYEEVREVWITVPNASLQNQMLAYLLKCI